MHSVILLRLARWKGDKAVEWGHFWQVHRGVLVGHVSSKLAMVRELWSSVKNNKTWWSYKVLLCVCVWYCSSWSNCDISICVFLFGFCHFSFSLSLSLCLSCYSIITVTIGRVGLLQWLCIQSVSVNSSFPPPTVSFHPSFLPSLPPSPCDFIIVCLTFPLCCISVSFKFSVLPWCAFCIWSWSYAHLACQRGKWPTEVVAVPAAKLREWLDITCT